MHAIGEGRCVEGALFLRERVTAPKVAGLALILAELAAVAATT